jgi:pimeloyl-ACP methyl ester carboxylesterase
MWATGHVHCAIARVTSPRALDFAMLLAVSDPKLAARPNRASAPARPHASRPTRVATRASSFDPKNNADRTEPPFVFSSRRGVLRAVSSALLVPVLIKPPPASADDLFCGYYVENKSVTPQWAFKTPWSEGAVDVSVSTKLKDAKTFLRILGKREPALDAGHLPVLCLHGGPGLGFKYMESLEILASETREVASYDQIGCARSSLSNLESAQNSLTFTPELFQNELHQLRQTAELEKVHIVAHGWGCMLALDHVLGGNGFGNGVASLTLVSCPPSYKQLIEDRRLALDKMPDNFRQVLLDGDANGSGGDNLSLAGKSLYASAWQEWTIRHESQKAAGACFAGLSIGGTGAGIGARRGDAATEVGTKSARKVFRDLTGGMYFTEGGSLAGWEADVNGRLGQISSKVPGTRVVRGENDALSEQSVGELVGGMTRSDMKSRVQFTQVADAGSCVFLDKSADFLEATNEFIQQYDDVL